VKSQQVVVIIVNLEVLSGVQADWLIEGFAV